jgi:hypothetical protein
MSFLAPIRMSFCNAFDRLHNPCLNEIPHGADVCEQHENFYTQAWFDRYVFRLEPNPTKFFFTSSEKIKNVYKKAILGSRIQITRQHFRQVESLLNPVSDFVDYYLLCCMQPNVDPLWSSKLFEASIKKILANHNKPTQLTRSNVSEYLNPIFNTNNRSFSSMLFYTIYYIIRLDDQLVRSVYAAADKFDNPEASFLQYVKTHPKFKKELLWSTSFVEDNIMSLLSNKASPAGSIHGKLLSFLSSLPELRLLERERHRDEFRPLGQEIVETAWNPDRSLKWCLSIDETKRYKDEYSKWGK